MSEYCMPPLGGYSTGECAMNRINAQPERRPCVCSPCHPVPPCPPIPTPIPGPHRPDWPDRAPRGFRDRTVPPALRAPWVPRAGQVIQAPPADGAHWLDGCDGPNRPHRRRGVDGCDRSRRPDGAHWPDGPDRPNWPDRAKRRDRRSRRHRPDRARSVTPAAAVANATSATDVVTRFNQLLENLRAAGLLGT